MEVLTPTQDPRVLSVEARPKLNRMFRLQWEEVQQGYVLLYPEGMVQLNASAAEIIRRCDGLTSVNELVADLESAFAQSGLRSQIVQLLAQAYARRWLV